MCSRKMRAMQLCLKAIWREVIPMKKSFYVFALMLIMLLTGCSTIPAETTGTVDTTAAPTTGNLTTVPPTTQLDPDTLPIYIDTEKTLSFAPFPSIPEEYEVTVTRLPGTVESPNNLPVLKWVCLATKTIWKPTEAWSETAMVEVNQMLADRDMPFRLQLIMVEMKGSVRSEVDWTAVPEVRELIAQADLLTGLFPQEKAEQYLTPITSYVTGGAQPSLQNAVIHPLDWKCTTYNNEIYGIPTGGFGMISNGWQVKTEMLEKWGLTTEDFQKNYWEMDELFSEIYEANDKKAFLEFSVSWGYRNSYPNRIPGIVPLLNAVSSLYQYDVGGGFVLDIRNGAPVVVDAVEAEDFRLIQASTIRYLDAGYAGSEKEPLPLQYLQTSGTVPYTSGSYTYIPVTENVCCDYYNGFLYLSGVALDTPYRAQAVQLLSLIADDEVFRVQLCCGKEGRDFKREDKQIIPLADPDEKSYSAIFISPLYSVSTQFGNSLSDYQGKYDEASYISCPIVFDFTGLEQELKDREVLLYNFYSRLARTKDQIIKIDDEQFVIPRMDETGYERMLQLLRDAGSERIRAALQAQLDAWLAEHPDWSAKIGD